jgi:hypothetical protein
MEMFKAGDSCPHGKLWLADRLWENRETWALTTECEFCQEYAAAQCKVAASEAYWQRYAKKDSEGRAVYLPEEFQAADPATNADRSVVEVYNFQWRDAGKDGYFAYWGKSTNGVFLINNWTGSNLGCVLEMGRAYECPAFGGFTSRRRNFNMLGIDGNFYRGVSYLSSGDYVRLKRIKTGSRLHKQLTRRVLQENQK